MSSSIQVSAATHVGRRTNNEDRFLSDGSLRLFAVADGMGGHEGGEVASTIAVERLREVVLGADADDTAVTVLNAAMADTHAAVRAARRGLLRHMGSTLSAVLLRHDQAAIAHVGDSRIYRLRAGVLECLTSDHSLAEELRRHGMEVPDDSGIAHVLTRALGTEHGQADVQRLSLCARDTLLLCSDGLYAALGEAVITEVLRDWPTELAAAELVQLAYDGGSSDNITAVVVQL